MNRLKILKVKLYRTAVGKVKARADIHFEGWLLKGFKVIPDEEKGKLYVTPPSYFSNRGWRELFRTDEVSDWNEIQRRVLETYEKGDFEGESLTGDPDNEPF